MNGEVNLHELHAICQLTPESLAYWAQAATVMLTRFHETPPPPTRVSISWDEERSVLLLNWTEPNHRAQLTHANELNAIEAGAYALSIVAAHHAGYEVRGRAEHASGADLLMVRRGEPDNDFVKLEVSGIATRGDVGARLSAKTRQVAGGNLRRPGVAAVVHFSEATVDARTS